MTREFEVRKEVTPAATPEQVWDASERRWEVLAKELGPTGEVKEGDRAGLAVAGLPRIEGVIGHVGLPSSLGVRTGDAMYRFIHSGADRGNVIVLGRHLFTDEIEEKEAERAWQSRLDGLTFA